MVHTRDFAECEFGAETPDTGLMWDEESCPLSQLYMDDMANLGSVVDQGAQVAVPWLLIHGSEDDVVPLKDSQDIVARAPHAQLVELPGAGHVFSDAATAPMVDAVVRWVREQMSH
jgi:pimeloyl-ACP methyl ester carboxylesterase